MFIVPRAARLASWLNAWLAGRESSDAVIAGVLGAGAAVDVRGWDDHPPLPPALLLGELRRYGVHRVSACLPRPGDPLGLGGPAGFNLDALEAGEAVVLHGPGRGLVPSASPAGDAVHWRVCPATPPAYLPQVDDSDRELRRQLLAAADGLAALDVATWSPGAADLLLNLRAPARFDAAMSLPSAEASRTFVSGLRGMEIVRIATRDEGGVTSSEMAARRDLLSPLEHAARAAVVAACSAVEKG